MALWRIINHCDLNGLGGEISSGRWHTAAGGKRVVYLSEHPAGALLETLANLRGRQARFLEQYQLVKVVAPDAVSWIEPELPNISNGRVVDRIHSQTIGDTWLSQSKSALLKVPSVPSPESWNYLLNPLHPDARKISIDWCRWITYDRRIFGIREKSN